MNFQYSFRDREKPFRFALPGSFEYKFALRWKQLYEMEVKEMVRLKKEMEDAVEKLESEMTNAMHDFHANQLREGRLWPALVCGPRNTNKVCCIQPNRGGTVGQLWYVRSL
jgi:hypothetical protein